jgi:hypothetical protein
MKKFYLLFTLSVISVMGSMYGMCASGNYSKGEYPPGESPGTGVYEGMVHGSAHPDYKIRPLPEQVNPRPDAFRSDSKATPGVLSPQRTPPQAPTTNGQR